jgi:hypothetical protein
MEPDIIHIFNENISETWTIFVAELDSFNYALSIDSNLREDDLKAFHHLWVLCSNRRQQGIHLFVGLGGWWCRYGDWGSQLLTHTVDLHQQLSEELVPTAITSCCLV